MCEKFIKNYIKAYKCCPIGYSNYIIVLKSTVQLPKFFFSYACHLP